jgi:hypothetical protein
MTQGTSKDDVGKRLSHTDYLRGKDTWLIDFDLFVRNVF